MQKLSNRLLSIDVLRAVTMFLMIFVNDLYLTKNIPLWIDHADGNADALGFADIIFPAFLFILGLSLPFAINSRIKKGESTMQILAYILSRSAALLIMGFYHVNLEEYNSKSALIPAAAWALIITTAFFLIWLDYPETIKKSTKHTLIGFGIVLLIAMAAIYKGGTPEHPVWMQTSWWGILGIIGWSYLVCALIYFASKGNMAVLACALAVFVAINIANHTGILPDQLWVIGDGSAMALTMGGVIISRLYTRWMGEGKAVRVSTAFLIIGVLLIAAGLLIRPYADGISKIRSTPAWVFICSGITILVFNLFIYVVDIQGKKNLFKTIRPAGTSTLTCYLIPYYWVFLLKLFHLKYAYVINNGAVGLLRAVIVSLVTILLVGLMEKKHLRLKI
ncbi:DUF5009 domain-containing protein [Mucilaginibacter agri]|uniref:DUF5009 domain-containing protein n=1 Tax=Mucilaginibacter agri TaxID=2695265 RepID=A0A965ZFM6_9SPHI|nr:DUF5009 domain-containing protein [Mucilaginibacter agri]NCD70020.1 DUF5009 domain-containing protein [Mucilaginibacter agri]